MKKYYIQSPKGGLTEKIRRSLSRLIKEYSHDDVSETDEIFEADYVLTFRDYAAKAKEQKYFTYGTSDSGVYITYGE